MYVFGDGFPRDNVISSTIELNVGPGADYENLDAVKAFLSGKVFAEGAGARLIFTPGTHDYPGGFAVSERDNIDWEHVSFVFPQHVFNYSDDGYPYSVVLSDDETNYLLKINIVDTSEAEVGMFVAAGDDYGIANGVWETVEVVANESITFLVKNTGDNSAAYLGATGTINRLYFLKMKLVGGASFTGVKTSISGSFAIDANAQFVGLILDASRIVFSADGATPIVATSGGFFGVMMHNNSFFGGLLKISSPLLAGVQVVGSVDFNGSISNAGSYAISTMMCFGHFSCEFYTNKGLISADRNSNISIYSSAYVGNISGGEAYDNSSVSISGSGYSTLEFTPALNVVAADGSVIYG